MSMTDALETQHHHGENRVGKMEKLPRKNVGSGKIGALIMRIGPVLSKTTVFTVE
jgi:hypothetical protein